MPPVASRYTPAQMTTGSYGAMAERMQQRNIDLDIERSVQSHLSVFQSGITRVNNNLPEVLERMPKDANGKPTVTAAEARAMLTDIQQEYNSSTQRLKGEVRQLYVNGPNGAPPDRYWLKTNTDQLNKAYDIEFNQKMLNKYGAKGQVLLEALHDETEYVQQGPLGRAMSKIGTPGGVIGAIAAGALAFFGMGGMEGGVLAIVGAFVGVMAGGVLGGTINNWVTESRKPKQPETPEQTLPEPGQDKTKEKDKEPSRTTPTAELTTGNLSPTTIPAAPPANPKLGFNK